MEELGIQLGEVRGYLKSKKESIQMVRDLVEKINSLHSRLKKSNKIVKSIDIKFSYIIEEIIINCNEIGRILGESQEEFEEVIEKNSKYNKITCTICKESQYKNKSNVYKVLFCGHILCHKCFETQRRDLNCPYCGKKTKKATARTIFS